MIKIGLIVEDLVDSRRWLETVLTDAFPGIEVHAVSNLTDGLAWIKHHTPDLALVDLGLPDGSGIDLISALNQKSAHPTIVVSSIFEDDQHLFSALRAGATGYVLKDQTKDSLIEMLKGISQGKPPLSPAIARRLLNFFAPPQAQTQDDPLTEREREVLQLISKGYTVAKSADMLGIAYSTAAGYVKVIYRKLNVTSRAEATLEASRRGLISLSSE